MEFKTFMAKAREIHGDKYDYKPFDDIAVTNKVKIVCKEHGEFEQAIYAHLRGQGCPKCVGKRRGYTTEDFIRDAKNKFGDRFDYSKVEYKNRRTKVLIMCKEIATEDNPNGEFYQKPFVHLESSNGMPSARKKGRKYKEINDENRRIELQKKFIDKAKEIHGDNLDFSKLHYVGTLCKTTFTCPIHGDFTAFPSNIIKGHGCPKCANTVPMTIKEFVEKAREIHGNKYDYSKTKITNEREKITITCLTHGDFKQYRHHHLKGHGCPMCSENKRLDKETFIAKAREIHGDKYDYSKVEYVNNHTKVCIVCPIHGEFWQTPSSQLSGQGCAECSTKSKLEDEVSKLLDENEIVYTKQKKFDTIRHNKPLPFDFYLPQQNIAIECQGIQHFVENDFFKDKDRFLKDKIKFEGCLENGIKLLYFSNINNISEYFGKLTYNEYNLFDEKEKLLNEIKKVGK